MIIVKSNKEIELMREAGKIVADTHELLKEAITPGISTLELDKIAEENIRKYNAIPSFKIVDHFFVDVHSVLLACTLL